MVQKLLDLFIIEWLWLQSPGISLFYKIHYAMIKYYVFFTKKKSINFLGNYFYFDNRFVPFLLEMYPQEIYRIIKALPTPTQPYILDIGANVGQWARTVLFYLPDARVDSFEPNPTLQTLLQNNAQSQRSWRIFPYGIGSKEKEIYLYYDPAATDGGSFVKEKKDLSLKKVKTRIVSFTSAIQKKYKLPSHYDIVKIDVEGMEKEVLLGISSLDFSVLSIEVDTGRGFGLKVKDVLYIVNNLQKRNMDCIGITKAHANSPEGNALFVKNNI